MPKSTSPSKVEELPSTSPKAKFFYTGVFALSRKRLEASPPKQPAGRSTSTDNKKSPKK